MPVNFRMGTRKFRPGDVYETVLKAIIDWKEK